jgi:UTP--glucose-1-phosphate uridylyltransferase
VLRKAVIPAAGLGTRLLSVTKEQPKEMLPVFARGKNGELCLKPIVRTDSDGVPRKNQKIL